MPFTDFYETNPVLDNELFMSFAVGLYPEFIQKNQINYKAVSDLLEVNNARAKACFLSLFSPSHTLKPNVMNQLVQQSAPMQNIIQNHGPNILAHGVEEAKGGLRTLAMIAMTRQVRVPPAFWGEMVPGQPNTSPLMHGPYFIVFSTDNENETRLLKNGTDLKMVEHVVVPFQENIDYLNELFKTLANLNMIKDENIALMQEKLVTYEQFSQQLNQQQQNPLTRKMPATEAEIQPSKRTKPNDYAEPKNGQRGLMAVRRCLFGAPATVEPDVNHTPPDDIEEEASEASEVYQP